MRDEHTMTRQGKKMALYGGLLAEAHEKGLRSIDTELLQIPTPDNGNVAICKATVELEDGRTFSGIGDASPENVGRNIVPHIIRMSETRAKARALRDATNISEALLDDASTHEDDSPSQPTGGRPTGKSGGQNEEGPERTPGGATLKAAGYLEYLAKKAYGGALDVFEADELGGKKIEDLSAKQVKTLIEGLKS